MPKDTQPEPEEILIREEPIELAQLLKFAGFFSTGGEAKLAVTEGLVSVNGEVEIRRGRKLKAGDLIAYEGKTLVVRVS